MHKPDNPFNQLYVPQPYDDTVTIRKVEASGRQLIVTDFNRNSHRIVAQDMVFNNHLQTRAAYDENTQTCTQWHTPTQSQYFDYDAQGRLQSVLAMPRPLVLN